MAETPSHCFLAGSLQGLKHKLLDRKVRRCFLLAERRAGAREDCTPGNHPPSPSTYSLTRDNLSEHQTPVSRIKELPCLATSFTGRPGNRDAEAPRQYPPEELQNDDALLLTLPRWFRNRLLGTDHQETSSSINIELNSKRRLKQGLFIMV